MNTFVKRFVVALAFLGLFVGLFGSLSATTVGATPSKAIVFVHQTGDAGHGQDDCWPVFLRIAANEYQLNAMDIVERINGDGDGYFVAGVVGLRQQVITGQLGVFYPGGFFICSSS
jgi:hypothetical protein